MIGLLLLSGTASAGTLYASLDAVPVALDTPMKTTSYGSSRGNYVFDAKPAESEAHHPSLTPTPVPQVTNKSPMNPAVNNASLSNSLWLFATAILGFALFSTGRRGGMA
ncbi:hypothetical protein [endosymbiont of unidentified scaly snail isolate Monju]|uniref:hypothetical protein n=1 Tax=endosymbiont of unidentified scaly snail isolate Monju TaxID=1248727 RepID=UPI00149401F2|nr:hypothetical protein [endosymbiont of unidentified scaly snail isolate Monju]